MRDLSITAIGGHHGIEAIAFRRERLRAITQTEAARTDFAAG